jgi:hypothetical protein
MIRSTAAVLFAILWLSCPVRAYAACDELVGSLIRAKLRPVVEDLDCAVVKKPGGGQKGP